LTVTLSNKLYYYEQFLPANKIIKAAAVQISPVLYSREGTIEKVVRKIRELGKQSINHFSIKALFNYQSL
jgi:hypothetical protein